MEDVPDLQHLPYAREWQNLLAWNTHNLIPRDQVIFAHRAILE